jgi:poly(A) polymerase
MSISTWWRRRKTKPVSTPVTPVTLPRAEHNISRALISEHALKVLYRLKDAGYDSYLVGGCVRDLMLGREPKDFDVVTNATPEQVKGVFRNARLIGRRFRLAHVQFGRDIIEVATYRANPQAPIADDDSEEDENEGRLLRDNVFGTQIEDAVRRDFTVNSLYYDIRDFSVVDYVGGVKDLEQGILRMIGDPITRYREDPVRMLRVIRFAAKLGFRIDPATAAPIRESGRLLLEVPPARLFEEVLKLFQGGYALETFELLRQYGLFRYLFPLTEDSLAQEENHFPRLLVPQALANTDERIAADKPVNPAFLFAAFLWEPVRLEMRRLAASGMKPHETLQHAADNVLREQLRHITIPKRFTLPMREIWDMQGKLSRRHGKHAERLVEHKRFRAAYDFLLLRAHAGEEEQALADWWTRFQEVDAEERDNMARTLVPSPGAAQRKRRPRKRRATPRDAG